MFVRLSGIVNGLAFELRGLGSASRPCLYCTR